MPDIEKIAVLAMLSPQETEKTHLTRDVAEILAMGRQMPACSGTPVFAPVLTGMLREDSVHDANLAVACMAQSKKRQDGFITVSRTVGGEV